MGGGTWLHSQHRSVRVRATKKNKHHARAYRAGTRRRARGGLPTFVGRSRNPSAALSKTFKPELGMP
eukprot:15436332-Alexandrium_andersonii.AAC.1